MTLHEAIINLLKEFSRAMTTTEIATQLNKNGWYKKKDGSAITAYQVHGRTNNYPQFFTRKGSLVGLVNENLFKPLNIVQTKKEIITNEIIDIGNLEEELLNENTFIGADCIDNLIPACSGLYCIRIKNHTLLPEQFKKILEARNHNILYIGIASQNLNTRLLGQELRARGHGTFFRSLGAILGYLPPKGSLTDKKNKRNYKFSKSDETEIINWINKNLVIKWINYSGDFGTLEKSLISKYLPLINLDHNPQPSSLLRQLRAECVRIANLIN